MALLLVHRFRRRVVHGTRVIVVRVANGYYALVLGQPAPLVGMRVRLGRIIDGMTEEIIKHLSDQYNIIFEQDR